MTKTAIGTGIAPGAVDVKTVQALHRGNIGQIRSGKMAKQSVLELSRKVSLWRKGGFHGLEQLGHPLHLLAEERVFAVLQSVFQLLKDGEITVDLSVQHHLQVFIIGLILLHKGLRSRDQARQNIQPFPGYPVGQPGRGQQYQQPL